ncbi:MAG: hypothetical protein GQ525_03275, partial [Draconibacterium sp.]|nr:hypothetical protein [Draconibacterium sp.]
MKKKRIFLFLTKRMAIALVFFSTVLMFNSLRILAQDINPTELEFRRQAVQRMIFDQSQNIPLAGLFPAKVVGLDVMHPPVGQQENNPKLAIENGRLQISAQKPSTATRWIGGFNPFAVYDVAINKFSGTGEIGMVFRESERENRITATLVANDGNYQSIRCVIVLDSNEVEHQEFSLPEKLNGNDPIRFRVQMMAVGANFFVEVNGTSTLIGRMDFVQHFDLRRKDLMQRFEFCLYSQLEAGASVEIDEATAALSPGIGQADIRTVTYEDGSPFFKDERLWLTMTVRGGG